MDSALRTLIEREASGTRDVEIVFDAPTREWAGRRNSPTIDVYLYDIREDLRRRERGMYNVYNESNVVVSRHLPPRHFKLSYLVTAWTQRPEDEHRLLSSLLSCFLKYDALPVDVLTGPLTDLGLPIPITIALPPPEDRAFADVWSALGGELKPSIDLVVSTPLDTGQQFHTGPPVERPPQVSLGGSYGWPTREAKSRNGVEVWPTGIDGPTPTSEDADSDAGGWERATGWADSMAPLGSAGSVEPLPERAAGHRPPGAAEASGQAAVAGTTAPTDERAGVGTPEAGASGGGRAKDPAKKASASGAAKKTAGEPGKAGGRPGTRVAIARKRQPKKRS